MKPQASVYEGSLRASSIDEASGAARDFLTKCQLPHREVVRYAMSIEEILNHAVEHGYEGTAIELEMRHRFFRPFLKLTVEGKPDNVYTGEQSEQSLLGNVLLKSFGISPDYVYAGNRNEYAFRIRGKKLNPFIKLFIALCAAVLFGLLGLLLPEDVRVSLRESILLPLHDTFLNILGCIAGPMVFLSVAWGIYGIGDAATLKQVGKRMLLGYIGAVFVAVFAISWICLPLFSLHFTHAGDGSAELSSVLTMLLNVFPKNIFSPFVDGNTLQIIFLAAIIGITMLILGQKTTAVAKAVEQINYIVQLLIELVSGLVPYFIFIVLLDMIWSDTISVMLRVGKFFIVLIVAILLLIAAVLFLLSATTHISPFLLAKKGLPTLLIALTTASSAAAFGTNTKTCREQLGIHHSLVSFGVPLGIATFKPATAVSYLILSFFFVEVYGIPISVPWYLILLFTVCVLALATPPIPGGALASYTLLFAVLGIPAEALAVALACDTVLDFITSGTDQFLLQFQLLRQANKLGMVDTNILKKKKAVD